VAREVALETVYSVRMRVGTDGKRIKSRAKCYGGLVKGWLV
jgi:hypothetical protein